MKLINKTGWLPPLDDDRDYPLQALPLAISAATVPEQASIETFIERIDDQKSKPWCVAFGVCNALEFAMKMRGMTVPKGGLSKAYLYTRCKQLDGVPNSDGTYIRTALQVAATEGICPDYLCPTETYLQQSTLPILTTAMKNEAAKYKIKTYARLKNDATGYIDQEQIKQAIANMGFVIIGSWVEVENWLDGDDLIVAPKGTILGGHCTFLHSYNNSHVEAGCTGFYGGVNSWGTSWGDNGKYLMAYDYAAWKTLDLGQPALQEAWAFTVVGEVKMKTYEMPIAMQILSPGHTMLPFRGLYEALGGIVRYYKNADNRTIVVAEVALKDKTVVIEATQDSQTLKVFEKA